MPRRDRAPYEAAIERLQASSGPLVGAKAETALKHASGALSACLEQIAQMSGMFDDADGAIVRAEQAGIASVAEIEKAIDSLKAVERASEPSVLAAVYRIRGDWQARQTDGEMNETAEHEEADTVVDVLNDVLRAAEKPEAQPTVHIVLGMEGGIVQGGWSDAPVDVTIFDYDTEGADEDRIITVPQGDGDTAEAYIGGTDLEINPRFVAEALQAVKDGGVSAE